MAHAADMDGRPVTVTEAGPEQLDAAAALFDQYRQFYGRPADLDGARLFLGARLSRGENIVLLARRADETIGFAQLYPGFSSIRMRPILVLNDLFVSPAGRGAGVGAALLRAAEEHGRRSGVAAMTLSTNVDNHAARGLYETRGWRPDPFVHFVQELDAVDSA